MSYTLNKIAKDMEKGVSVANTLFSFIEGVRNASRQELSYIEIALSEAHADYENFLKIQGKKSDEILRLLQLAIDFTGV